MNFASATEAKAALQSLTESAWIFAALNVAVETGAVAAMREPVAYEALEDITKLPRDVLNQTLNVLHAAGFVVLTTNTATLAPGMNELIQASGMERITSQLQVTTGITQEYIKQSREKKLTTGWSYTDERILQAQGQHSEYVVTDCVPLDAELENLLKQSSANFLDIGAGVGKIALKICDIYPNAKVVALEPADAPFALARKNIVASNHAARIDLRKMLLQDIPEKDFYDVIWFPQIFFPENCLEDCLSVIWRALKPGGKLLTTAIADAKINQGVRIRQLLNSLFGGLRSADKFIQSLTDAGFREVKVFSEAAGYLTITATKASNN